MAKLNVLRGCSSEGNVERGDSTSDCEGNGKRDIDIDTDDLSISDNIRQQCLLEETEILEDARCRERQPVRKASIESSNPPESSDYEHRVLFQETAEGGGTMLGNTNTANNDSGGNQESNDMEKGKKLLHENLLTFRNLNYPVEDLLDSREGSLFQEDLEGGIETGRSFELDYDDISVLSSSDGVQSNNSSSPPENDCESGDISDGGSFDYQKSMFSIGQ